MSDPEGPEGQPAESAGRPEASSSDPAGAPTRAGSSVLAPYDLYADISREREKESQLYDRIVADPQYVDVLKKAFESYSALVELRVGDVIQWKPLMKNRRYPNYGAPAVLVRQLPEVRVADEDGEALPEPEDIVVGWVTGDRTFALFTTSSARFEAWAD